MNRLVSPYSELSWLGLLTVCADSFWCPEELLVLIPALLQVDLSVWPAVLLFSITQGLLSVMSATSPEPKFWNTCKQSRWLPSTTGQTWSAVCALNRHSEHKHSPHTLSGQSPRQRVALQMAAGRSRLVVWMCGCPLWLMSMFVSLNQPSGP